MHRLMVKTLPRFNNPIWFPIFMGSLLRLINIQAPIVGVHSWRQADTAAMARHFFLENTPIWLPQIDWAGASEGYVECEFPLFPYLVGQLYKVFGLHEWIGRGLSLIFSVISIFLIIRIGSELFDRVSGWWGGLFFALLPLNVYYGRTFQAESLLILLAILSIYSLYLWKRNANPWSLFVSWISFCLACLLKLLPFIWLGLPLLIIQAYGGGDQSKISLRELSRRVVRSLLSPGVLVYGLSALLLVSIWFLYSYKLGSESGFSFFIWGKNTDRVSIDMLLNLQVWSNLLLRILLRNLALVGLPLLIIGLFSSSSQLTLGSSLKAGLVGMFICTTLAMRSSSVHEYYQLPLQIFFCPFMGHGWHILINHDSIKRISNYLFFSLLILITSISVAILYIDYFSVESNQEEIWMPLATKVRNEVKPNSRVISVTGLDPTLLNLMRRQGWLTSVSNLNEENIKNWKLKGATHIVGSLNWQETYIRLSNDDVNDLKMKLSCEVESSFCPRPPHYTYFVPIEKITN